MENATCVQATLLGDFQMINSHGKLDTDIISSEKITSLLTYLLVHRDRPLSVHELTDTLWAEKSTDNPTGALKNLIYRLRKLLKQHLGDFPFILTGKGTYTWNAEIPLQLDTEDFTQTVQTVRTCAKSQRTALLAHAVMLYRGRFLDFLCEETWVTPLCAYYQSLYLSAVRQLADLYEDAGRFEDMEQLCSMALTQDGLDEALHCGLIRALLLQGRTRTALEHCQRATALLTGSLGIAPPASLQKLQRDILSMNRTAEIGIADMRADMREHAPKGGYLCEYSIFCEIYRLEARRCKRLGSHSHMLIVTMACGQQSLADEHLQQQLMKKAMRQLLKIIRDNLRIGDVLSQFSEFQLGILLPVCTTQDAHKIIVRLRSLFYEQYPRQRFTLSWAMEEVR